LPVIYGHGAMVTPVTWHDPNAYGAWFINGKNMKLGCGQLNMSIPYNEVTGNDPDCVHRWWSDETFNLNKEQSIPDDFFQMNVTCTGQRADPDKSRKASELPFASPGTAPIYGGPCGAMGGKPLGCKKDGKGDPYECCNDTDCGNWAFGPLAHETPELYENAVVTIWERYSVQEVGWYVEANHAGGYAYRLCKIPENGISSITEDCFNEGHLDFHGEIQWIQTRKNNSGEKTVISALRVKEGPVKVYSGAFLKDRYQNGTQVHETIISPHDQCLNAHTLVVENLSFFLIKFL